MIKSHSRGHKIIYENEKWIYTDNKQEIDENRPCKRCGKSPTKEGHDACIGHVENIESACCGHGIQEPYQKRKLT